ncbi:MAG: type VI secretion system baseplate subunit TssK [bacterium]
MQRPLFWHQGLFLQPQHFQLQDAAFQSLLTPFYHFVMPYFWGIGEVEVQKAALGIRSFSLLKGEFLFPDGTYVVFPGNSLIEARSFDQAWVEGGKPFPIYIGLKKWDPQGENVTVLPKSGNLSQGAPMAQGTPVAQGAPVTQGTPMAAVTTRFVTSADAEEVKDLHQQGPAAQVKRLSYALRIFWETEKDQLGDYLLMPLTQIERAGEEIRLSERFIPPSLTISGSKILLGIVREIRDQITARGRQLEEYKRQKGIHTAEFGARDMVYLLALRSLNRYVPPLFQVMEAQKVHPWTVYGLLRQLIGELSSFSEKIKVMGETEDGTNLLPAYDHRNLWACFSAAQGLVTQLLDEITAGPEYVIRLHYDGTYYAADLPPGIFDGGHRYYLVLKTDQDPGAALQSLKSMAKVNCREYLPILIARSLPGIRLEHLPIPPQELPRRSNCIYLKIDHHAESWAMVEKNRNLALYWDDAPEDLEAELMIVERSS